MAEEEGDQVLTPVIIREMGGTLYVVYGYFSPGATETATNKIRRLLLKESKEKGRERH